MSEPLIALSIFALLVLVVALIAWPNKGLLSRWHKSRRMDERVLIEDALKHLHRSTVYSHKPTIQSVAGALSISTGHAAELMDRLAEMELVELTEDGYRLTADGETYALNVIRAHRLWERYLADETGYSETEWHEMADLMEHSLSPEEVRSLSAGLGFPSYDPHGDPIPTAEGNIQGHGGQPLSIMPPGAVLQVVHIEDEPDTVYAQILAEGIYPGMRLKLLEATPTRIRYWSKGREFILAPVTAANISVRPITTKEPLADTESEQLNDLKVGESAKIVHLSNRLRGMERRRLLDLGLIPGTLVTAELASPGGDPVAYRIRGALIALRQDQSRLIDIERVDGDPVGGTAESAKKNEVTENDEQPVDNRIAA